MAATYWEDEPDPPLELFDYPRECMFCGRVVERRGKDPHRVDVSSHLTPDMARLFVAHEACLNERLHAIYIANPS